jgi:hypothetical protein
MGDHTSHRQRKVGAVILISLPFEWNNRLILHPENQSVEREQTMADVTVNQTTMLSCKMATPATRSTPCVILQVNTVCPRGTALTDRLFLVNGLPVTEARHNRSEVP